VFSSGWHPSRLVRACIAVGLAIIGAVLIWAALPRPSTPDPALAPAPSDHSMSATSPAAKPTQKPRAPSADQSDLRDQTTGLVLPESEPVTLSIRKLGVRAKLIELGLKDDGTMQVPKNAGDPGWFTRAPSPGALGPAVIAGHVRWNGALGVFHRLDTLRRGDQVTVTRKDGKTAIFTVIKVDQHSKARFPTQAVYGPINHAGLRLITCGGGYDGARRRYLDNVVVFAKLTEVR
jgi:Sortase domain